MNRFVDEAGQEVDRYRVTKADGTSELVNIKRAAELTAEGTPLNAANLNGIIDMAIHFCSCTYSGGVYTLTGDTLPETIGAVPINVQFVAPSQYNSGETFRYKTQSFTPKNASFAAGDLVVVASLIGSQIFFRAGGAATPPDQWENVGLYTANATLTVLRRGWYRITCIGAGGRGGNGGDGDLYDWTDFGEGYEAQSGGGAAGGGSGGIAQAIFLLDRGNYIITVNATVSSFGDLIAAYCGKPGGNGGYISSAGDNQSPGVGGEGGGVSVAEGAILVFAQSGAKGENGTNPSGSNSNASTKEGTPGGNGAVNPESYYLSSYAPAVGGTAGRRNVDGGAGENGQTGTSASPRFGGGGAGGGGGSGPSKGVGSKYLSNYSSGGLGGYPAPGCVQVEKGAAT